MFNKVQGISISQDLRNFLLNHCVCSIFTNNFFHDVMYTSTRLSLVLPFLGYLETIGIRALLHIVSKKLDHHPKLMKT